MILRDFKAFPRRGRIIGVDWGAVRLGLAVSDESREFTFTRPVVVSANRGGDLVARVAAVAADERAVGIVIGLPLRTDGTESDTTAAVRAFADSLAAVTDLPICFIDETLTSAAAAEQAGIHNPRAAKTKLDSVSARVILENAIAVINRL